MRVLTTAGTAGTYHLGGPVSQWAAYLLRISTAYRGFPPPGSGSPMGTR